MRVAIWRVMEWFGWLFCEASFRAPHWLRLPLVGWSYRLGCWFYGHALRYGKANRFLKLNPRRNEPDEPRFIDAI